MLGLVTTLNDKAPVELRELPEPRPQRNEALVVVHAFSLNRGELRSVRNNGEGWIPGQDVAGVVMKQAEDGSGPPSGARVVALTDEFGWAQRVAVAGHRMAVLPDNVSFAHAATLPVAGLTALKELGALDVIEGIDKAQGRFSLILESGGGASLAQAIKLAEAKGSVVVYGNSSGEPTTLSFADFRGAPNSRVQSFSYFYSEPEDRFAPDLALLLSLIADGSLKPRIGAERSWRDFAVVAEQLRDRRVAGKAVLLVD
jgi:NADPH:quinone reductase-like Zn-dependent oxidoreductase